jgi:hypothetical protein
MLIFPDINEKGFVFLVMNLYIVGFWQKDATLLLSYLPTIWGVGAWGPREGSTDQGSFFNISYFKGKSS